MTKEAQLILSSMSQHICRPNQCSGSHGEEMMEIPSDIFIKACLISINKKGVSIEDNGIAPT